MSGCRGVRSQTMSRHVSAGELMPRGPSWVECQHLSRPVLKPSHALISASRGEELELEGRREREGQEEGWERKSRDVPRGRRWWRDPRTPSCIAAEWRWRTASPRSPPSCTQPTRCSDRCAIVIGAHTHTHTHPLVSQRPRGGARRHLPIYPVGQERHTLARPDGPRHTWSPHTRLV